MNVTDKSLANDIGLQDTGCVRKLWSAIKSSYHLKTMHNKSLHKEMVAAQNIVTAWSFVDLFFYDTTIKEKLQLTDITENTSSRWG